MAGKAPEGLAVLGAAMRLRPHDADLRLFAARAQAEHGKLERAEKLLAACRGRTHRAQWPRAAADLLRALGQPSAADAHLRALPRRFPQHHALIELSEAS